MGRGGGCGAHHDLLPWDTHVGKSRQTAGTEQLVLNSPRSRRSVKASAGLIRRLPGTTGGTGDSNPAPKRTMYSHHTCDCLKGGPPTCSWQARFSGSHRPGPGEWAGLGEAEELRVVRARARREQRPRGHGDTLSANSSWPHWIHTFFFHVLSELLPVLRSAQSCLCSAT